MQPIVSTPNRAQQVYELIRDGICDCSPEPGRHLVQEEPAATLGVSRHRYQIRVVLDQMAARLIAEQAASSPGFAARLRKEGDAILLAGEAAQVDGAMRRKPSITVPVAARCMDKMRQ